MAKISVHGGASDVPDALKIRRFQIGDDRKSVGSNLEPSENTAEVDDNKPTQTGQQPAPTMDSRSKARGKATRSSARSTGGSGRETEQPQSRNDEFDF